MSPRYKVTTLMLIEKVRDVFLPTFSDALIPFGGTVTLVVYSNSSPEPCDTASG